MKFSFVAFVRCCPHRRGNDESTERLGFSFRRGRYFGRVLTGMVLTIACAGLMAAPEEKIRVSTGQVRAVITMRMKAPLAGKGAFRIQIPTQSLQVALILPDGTRLAKPTILTRQFAVEDPSTAGFANASDAPREVVFRALRSQPAGEYRLEIFGTSPRDCHVSARFEPYQKPKSSGGGSRCEGEYCGPTAILLAPLIIATYLPEIMQSRRENRARDRRAPTYIWVSGNFAPQDGFGREDRFHGVGDRIEVILGLDSGIVRKVEKAELDIMIAPGRPIVSNPGSPPVWPTAEEYEKTTVPIQIEQLSKRAFRATFTPVTTGVYRFGARIEGVLEDGRRFTVSGEGGSSLPVEGEAVEFLESRESLVHKAGEAQPSAWMMRTKVKVNAPGEYAIYGRVGRPSASASCNLSKVQELAEGDQWIEMTFDGDRISECLASDGPTNVAPIQIYKHPVGFRSRVFYPPDYKPLSRTLLVKSWASNAHSASGVSVQGIP